MTKGVDFDQLSVHAGPEESPGFLLWRISTQWRSAIEAVLKPLDLTHPQFVVLAVTGWLTKNGERVTQVEIGRQAALDPNTTSQILRGLEVKGFIKRVQKIDSRSKNPTLTDKGAKVLARALPAVEVADAEFFSGLGGKETGSLVKIFQKLM